MKVKKNFTTKIHFILINLIIFLNICPIHSKELDLKLDKSFKNTFQYNDIPNLGGDSINNTITDEEEQILGKQVFLDITSSVPLEKNLFIQEYIQDLGEKLISHSPSIANYKFKFFVVDSSIINAFALPGGFIGINKGLIELAKNETELASVMAHEIAHVTQRHIARAMQNQSKMQLPYLAGILGSIILAAYDPELAQGALAATMASSHQASINFTRSNEEEADRVGIKILVNAGYNPNGMADFFEKMHKASLNGMIKIPELLRTHPFTESRMSEAQSFASNYPFRFYNDSLKFHLVKTLFKFQHKPNLVELRNTFSKQISSGFYNNKDAAELGLAMTYLYDNNKNSNLRKASSILSKLYKKHQEEDIIVSNFSYVLYRIGQKEKSFNILKEYLEVFPNNFPIIAQSANMILEDTNNTFTKTRAKLIEKYLQKYISSCYEATCMIYPTAFNLLAKIQLANGKDFQAHQNQAEFLASLGNYPAAVYQLKNLMKDKKLEKYQKKMLSTRIDELTAEYRRLID